MVELHKAPAGVGTLHSLWMPPSVESWSRLHRSFDCYCAAPLIALIYLCCGVITIDLPRR